MLLAHAAANVYNDVGDDITGADPDNVERIYPYTGGSRFIQSGLLSRAQMTRLALGLGAAALLLGALLAALRGPGVIWLGCAGLGLGLLYSLPGVQLSARGWGELTVAIAFGALPVLGSVWLQTGFVDLGAVLICLPVSAWAAAILVINEVPDIDADRRAQSAPWSCAGACRRALDLPRSPCHRARGLGRGHRAARTAAVVRAAGRRPGGSRSAGARACRSEPAERPRLKRSIELTLRSMRRLRQPDHGHPVEPQRLTRESPAAPHAHLHRRDGPAFEGGRRSSTAGGSIRSTTRCMTLDSISTQAATLTRQPSGGTAMIDQTRLNERNGACVALTSIRSGRCSTARELNCRRKGPSPTTCSTWQTVSDSRLDDPRGNPPAQEFGIALDVGGEIERLLAAERQRRAGSIEHRGHAH